MARWTYIKGDWRLSANTLPIFSVPAGDEPSAPIPGISTIDITVKDLC
ncbi:hypothetical protein [Streptomyces sp. A3M-1-3]|nr:hypothetical protein [Streptomyces sp. A3M-1-3]